MADEPTPTVEWAIPDGAVRIYNQFGRWGPQDGRSLVIVRHATEVSNRYGAVFIQFPERGAPSGGSSWWSGPECFKLPSAPDELLWWQQYHTAKRVRDLEAALVEAKADVEAVKRWAVLMAGMNDA